MSPDNDGLDVTGAALGDRDGWREGMDDGASVGDAVGNTVGMSGYVWQIEGATEEQTELYILPLPDIATQFKVVPETG